MWRWITSPNFVRGVPPLRCAPVGMTVVICLAVVARWGSWCLPGRVAVRFGRFARLCIRNRLIAVGLLPRTSFGGSPSALLGPGSPLRFAPVGMTVVICLAVVARWGSWCLPERVTVLYGQFARLCFRYRLLAVGLLPRTSFGGSPSALLGPGSPLRFAPVGMTVVICLEAAVGMTLLICLAVALLAAFEERADAWGPLRCRCRG
jgi:hypothetical protein